MGQHLPPHVKDAQRKAASKGKRLAPTPRLKSGVIRVVRPDGVYIGTGEKALILQSSGAAAITELLDGTHTRVDIAAKTGAPKERVEQILIALESSGLIDRDYEECAFTPTIAERMAPELSAISFREGVSDGGSSLLQRRQSQRVDIVGGDRIGMTIATILAASGVGRINVLDHDAVTPVDVIGAAVRLNDVGGERSVIAQQRIKEAMPAEVTTPSSTADLVLLTQPPMPEQVMDLGLAGVVHLIVETEPDGVVIGPLVIPGSSSCSRCMALSKVDRDRHWGVVEMVRLRRRITPSALASHLAAAHASAQILLYLDTGSCPVVNRTLHLGLADGFLRPREWRPHPLCGCSWR